MLLLLLLRIFCARAPEGLRYSKEVRGSSISGVGGRRIATNKNAVVVGSIDLGELLRARAAASAPLQQRRTCSGSRSSRAARILLAAHLYRLRYRVSLRALSLLLLLISTSFIFYHARALLHRASFASFCALSFSFASFALLSFASSWRTSHLLYIEHGAFCMALRLLPPGGR